MAYDVEHRDRLLDAVVDYLIENGVSGLSLRPLAHSIGFSTRVLAYHFQDKEVLIASALARLDERQREDLSLYAGELHARNTSVGRIVVESWRWQMREDRIKSTALVHEIEGLSASGRLSNHVMNITRARTDYVASLIESQGVAPRRARQIATLTNATYSGLQKDALNSGDWETANGVIDELGRLVDRLIVESSNPS